MYLRARHIGNDEHPILYRVTEEGFFRVSNEEYNKKDTATWDRFIDTVGSKYLRTWVWDVLTEDEAFVEIL